MFSCLDLPIRFNTQTLLAVSDGALDAALLHLAAEAERHLAQQLLPLLLGLGGGQGVHILLAQPPGIILWSK